IDLVITHTVALPSGALAATLAGKSHVWYIHEYGDIDHNFKFNFGKSFTLSLINRLSDKIIVNSKALFRHYQAHFRADKLYKVYYAVQYPLFAPMLHKPKDTLSISMVGRIAAGKNQLIALMALAVLKEKNIFPSITFIGSIDNTYLDTLQAFSRQYNLDNQIAYIGQTSLPWKYIEQSHCVLVCSKNEAFGRVTVEAMKAGKIAVISSSGAGAELVEHEKTGYLFDPEDAVALAVILEKLWNMTDTADMTQQAHVFAHTHFNEEIHTHAIMDLISNIKLRS
ncbi:MAG: glycosyltransferase family 4 protein, partial [Cytophagales bacterium]|nr:glycosyltransferase family 4 protein [Cytophaga sp.]